MSKKYVVSSIVVNSKVNYFFVEALLNYCKLNKAELFLVPLTGTHKEKNFSSDVLAKLGKYFIKDFTFNDNLELKDLGFTANTKEPRWGVKEICYKGKSLILASTKQVMETIPVFFEKEKPHFIYSTGTICECTYPNTITGKVNQEKQKLGALLIDIKDDKTFLIRNIEWKKKCFVDLNKKYSVQDVEKIWPSTLVAGDFHLGGDEDESFLKMTSDQLKYLNCKELVIHDLVSHNSINHHTKDNWMSGLEVSKNNFSLEKEHTLCVQTLAKYFPKIKLVITNANHNDWLNKYVHNKDRWLNDSMNLAYSFDLIQAAMKGEHVLEYAIKKKIKDLKFQKKLRLDDLVFLRGSDSYKVAGWELACHGDKGIKGAYGNLKNIELSAGSCVTAHTHSPKMNTKGICVGANCKIPLPYAKSTAYDWAQANCAIYPTGHAQLLISCNGVWK